MPRRLPALLPSEATPDAGRLLATRGVRGFVDGLVSVALPGYLLLLGFSDLQIGAVVTATLAGSALVTIAAGVNAHRLSRRRLLQLAALLMAFTGVAFGAAQSFWVLLAVAAVGTINPSAGDVSVFLPAEQSALPSTVPDRQRTALFGRYALIGVTAAALGALTAGAPEAIARRTGVDELTAMRGVFAVYALAGVAALVAYRRLTPAIEPPHVPAGRALGASRPLVYRLAALFSLDAFGGGFVVQSLLALWLFRRFELSVATAGAIFFWSGLLSGASMLVSVRLARRLGLIRTMVVTHVPANLFLIAAAFMPDLRAAVAALLARAALSQMDVPVRTSYVMAVVRPEERAAAASITNVPRSLVAAVPPLLAGWMLARSTFGWPLVIGGGLKVAYDIVLLRMFAHVRPPEEQDAAVRP